VKYKLIYKITNSFKERYETKYYYERNVSLLEIEAIGRWIGEQFCDSQMYPCQVESMDYTSEPTPTTSQPLEQEKMYGAVLSFHYLKIEPNSNTERQCVYDFLLSYYQPFIKDLNIETLKRVLGQQDINGGVTTLDIVKFCKEYNIVMYGLDLNMKVFHRYIPEKPSHKLKVLVFVCGCSHMFPVTEQSVRESIFAIERTKTNKISTVAFKDYTKSNNNEYELNIPWDNIPSKSQMNIVYTDVECLMELFIQLYKKENVIYQISQEMVV
jgi:hypothetical protein